MALAQPLDSGPQGMHCQGSARNKQGRVDQAQRIHRILRLADTAFRALTHPTGYKPYIPDLC